MDKAIKHECHVLHGDIPQAKREATLTAYKNGNFRVLVATDVAARGLDLSVEVVIQAKPPVRNMSGKADVETYVHRSGRTGRAGKSGICVTLWQPKTRYALEEIEKEIGNKFEWRGSLQPLEILAGCGQAVADELVTIDQSIFPYFQEAAKSVISLMGAEKALCAALAKISGFTGTFIFINKIKISIIIKYYYYIFCRKTKTKVIIECPRRYGYYRVP